MKSKTCHLVIVTLVAIFCTQAVAQKPYVGPTPGGPVREPRPALVGVRKMYVIVEPIDPRIKNIHGLKWKVLQDTVEQTLKNAGLEIAPGIVLGKGQRDRDIPEFRVYCDLTSLPNFRIHVFRCQTTLALKAKLPDKNLSFKAEVWQAEPAMHAVGWKAMPDYVKNVITVQTKSFISDWKFANSMDKIMKSRDYAVSKTPKTSKNPGAFKAKTPAAEYKYVASKKAKVFHEPDCSAAKKIKPENLTGYDRKGEAVKAGRRPCRLCKP